MADHGKTKKQYVLEGSSKYEILRVDEDAGVVTLKNQVGAVFKTKIKTLKQYGYNIKAVGDD